MWTGWASATPPNGSPSGKCLICNQHQRITHATIVSIELMPISADNLASPSLSVKLLRYHVETPAMAQTSNSTSLPSGKFCKSIPQRLLLRYSAESMRDRAISRILRFNFSSTKSPFSSKAERTLPTATCSGMTQPCIQRTEILM